MERIAYLLKQKAKALSVFEQAKTKMLAVNDQLYKEIEKAGNNTAHLEAAIVEEANVIEAARAEMKLNQLTIQKIEGLLG